MLKRHVRIGLLCALAVALASVAVAQEVPKPVVRLGDWLEISDDTWMNIIGNIDTRYNVWHNNDFDDDVRDIVATRNPTSSQLYIGPGDFLEAEIRFGADFRYRKSLTARILFETQSVFDGNLIDDNSNSNLPSDPNRDPAIESSGTQHNPPHVERFWIDYKFNPLLRMRVGADLWKVDQFGLLGDDDPAFVVFVTPTPDLELHARAVIQTESTRIGLTNDNDDTYYTFGVKYSGMKGHSFQLDGGYFRWRFEPLQEADTFMVIPNYAGNFGILQVKALAAAVFGEVDGLNGEDYDVFGYAFMANVEANLGKIRPFVGFVYGSGDDDPNDGDLNGFHHTPQNDISSGSNDFSWGEYSPSMADYGPSAGANAAVGGGVAGASTTGNMFLDRIGNAAHPGTTVAYSNAGTLRIGAGAHFMPMKGHTFTAYYQYVGILDDETLEAITPRAGGYDKTLFHEISAVWEWVLNKHFDIRALVNAHVPGGGTEDIASTVSTCGDGFQPCEGEEIAYRGTLRFRARF